MIDLIKILIASNEEISRYHTFHVNKYITLEMEPKSSFKLPVLRVCIDAISDFKKCICRLYSKGCTQIVILSDGGVITNTPSHNCFSRANITRNPSLN
ncbi:hypothetical protein HZS_959 [Henneguya salminicola]|nr:hypothetical protein HZS_959 [Henneguya salminicola]